MKSVLRQEYLVCYDIADNKSRIKVFKELRRQGLRHIQKSVFWGYLTRAEFNSIRRFISDMMDDPDKALIARTNINGRGQSQLLGYTAGQLKDWEENCVI